MARRGRGGGSNSKLMEMLAFVAVIALGVWVTIVFIINRWSPDFLTGTVVALLNTIAIALGALVALYYSYFYVRTKGKAAFAVWVVALILIIVFLVLGIAFPFGS